ncbi:MAG TPA: hypothetical protein VHL34_07775 [Rhizomicrobium sp.]|jgi:hypothetical protein|nr:hypothetical protein [Rhizomicrobium sp.]
MSTDQIVRVIGMTERLIAALEADITALEAGKPQQMKSIDLEVQKLAALYAREAAGITGPIAKAAPADLRSKLAATTAKFRDVLTRQARMLTRVRNASEGMIHAVAEEVDRRRTQIRPYGRTPTAAPKSAGAMIYNATA